MSGLSRKREIDWSLGVSCIIFTLMVFVRDMGIIVFGPISFIIVAALICLILPYQKLCAFYFYYISVGIGVHGGALIPIVLIMLLKSRKPNILQFVFSIVILVFEFFHLASYRFSVDFNRYVIYALQIVVFFFILFDDTTNSNILKKYLRLYINGIVVAFLIIFIHSVSGFGFNEIMMGNLRLGKSFNEEILETEMITSFNSNQLAYFSLAAFGLVLFIKNVYRNNLIKSIVMVVLTLAGIMSTSRTWILVFALTLAVYFIFNNFKGRFYFIIVAVIILIFSERYTTYSEAFSERFANRFEDANMATAGHRTEIIVWYNKWLSDHPERIVYGAGALYYNKVCQLRYSTHNGTQQILVCYGIIGLMLFTICIFTFYYRYAQKKHLKFWNYIPFLVCLVFIQAGQFISPAINMMPLLAATLPLKLFDDVE